MYLPSVCWANSNPLYPPQPKLHLKPLEGNIMPCNGTHGVSGLSQTSDTRLESKLSSQATEEERVSKQQQLLQNFCICNRGSLT